VGIRCLHPFEDVFQTHLHCEQNVVKPGNAVDALFLGSVIVGGGPLGNPDISARYFQRHM